MEHDGGSCYIQWWIPWLSATNMLKAMEYSEAGIVLLVTCSINYKRADVNIFAYLFIIFHVTDRCIENVLREWCKARVYRSNKKDWTTATIAWVDWMFYVGCFLFIRCWPVLMLMVVWMQTIRTQDRRILQRRIADSSAQGAEQAGFDPQPYTDLWYNWREIENDVWPVMNVWMISLHRDVLVGNGLLNAA